MLDENMIDHEVRIRLQEQNSIAIKDEMKDLKKEVSDNFRHLDVKLDSQFKWTIGIMIAMFGGSIIAKLI